MLELVHDASQGLFRRGDVLGMANLNDLRGQREVHIKQRALRIFRTVLSE